MSKTGKLRNVFVSSNFDNKYNVKLYMKLIETRNFIITYDHTNDNINDKINDKVVGIRSCDVLIVLLEDEDQNILIEIGIALGLNKTILIYNPNNPITNSYLDYQNIFIFEVLDELNKFLFDLY
jgi:hypothetical protein